MSLVRVVGPLASVVIPEVELPPHPYSPSVLLIVVAMFGLVSIFVFTAVCLGAGRLQERGLPMVRIAFISFAGLVGFVGLAAVIGSGEEAAHERAERAYDDVVNAADDQLIADLEAHYGLEVLDSYVPITVGGSDRPVTVDRGSGPEECFVAEPVDVLEVRCGGDGWETATAIGPVDVDG